jgi:pyruvyl transferase EpsI
VIHKQNGGLSDARNAGFEASHGVFVYFLDSDDYLADSAIEILYYTIEHEKADFIFFDAHTFFEDGISANRKTDTYIREHHYASGQGAGMLAQLRYANEYRSPVQLLFIRKTLINNSGVRFYKGIIHEDNLFTIQLFMLAEKVAHCPFPLYYRRMRNDSIVTKPLTVRNFEGYYTVFRELANLYNNIEDDAKKKALSDELCDRYRDCGRVYKALSRKQRGQVKRQYKDVKRSVYSNKFFGPSTASGWFFYLKEMNNTTLKVNKGSLRPIALFAKGVIHLFKGARDSNPALQGLDENRIFVIGTPTHGNLGDHAIAAAQIKFLNDSFPGYRIIEVPMQIWKLQNKTMRRYMKETDILTILGGGWLGTLWFHNELTVRDIIKAYPDNKIVIFPQTVFYEENENGNRERAKGAGFYSAHDKLVFCLRDKASYDLVSGNGFISNHASCLFAPDMALYLNESERDNGRDGVLLCFRRDREKTLSENDALVILRYLHAHGVKYRYSSSKLNKEVPIAQRAPALEAKYEEFSKARLVITDRLHCMIFAAITGTPCVAMDNLSGKVKGVYEWIKDLNYIEFAGSPEDAAEKAGRLLEMGGQHYNNRFLLPYFQRIVAEMKA